MNLYKLTFNTDIPYLDDVFNLLTDIEKERISSFDIKSSFHYNENNMYIAYILISPHEMLEYENILISNLIPYLCEDYTLKATNCEFDLESELEYYDDINLEYDNFIIELNKCILSNLTIDSILDRINERGIKSLRSIDKEFLENI